MDTAPRVLVAYATAAGSTAGIAEHIAGVLREAGAEVVCAPVSPELDPVGFDALVVGSAVHDMAWLPPAVDFLSRAALTATPTWCFSVGGLAGPYRNRFNRRMASRELGRTAQAFPASFVARDHRMFSGVVDLSGTPLWGRVFYRLTGGGPGDHRDWADIARWARRVAGELPQRRPSATDIGC